MNIGIGISVATALTAFLVAVGGIVTNRRQAGVAAKAVAVQAVVAQTTGYATQFKILSGTVETLDHEITRLNERNAALERLWEGCRKREEQLRQYLVRRDPSAMDELFGEDTEGGT